MSPVLIVILSIVAFIGLILVFPFQIIIESDGTKIDEYFKVLFFKIKLKTEDNELIKNVKVSDGKTMKVIKKKPDKDLGVRYVDIIKFYIDYIKVLVGQVLKHAKLRLKQFEIVVASDDAAKTAVMYGGISAACSTLFGVLSSYSDFKISKKAKGIRCDFLKEKMKLHVELSIGVNIIKGVAILLPISSQYIKIEQEI